MNIEIKILPNTVYYANDRCLPRWMIILVVINRSSRILLLDKLKICIRGNSDRHNTTLSGGKLKQCLLDGDLTLKPKEFVVLPIFDDGKPTKPSALNLKLLFAGRNGFSASVSKNIKLSVRPTIWLDFPLTGRWTTGNGREVPHSLGTQFGFDFITAPDMEAQENPPQKQMQLNDFSSFGKPIFAPCSGLILSCSNNQYDYKRFFKPTIGSKKVSLNKLVGNYVFIKKVDNQFILLAHMQKGSLNVRTGDYIEAGTYLGNVGNSGNTTGPHLHMEVIDEELDFSQKTAGIGSLGSPSGLPFGFENATQFCNNSKSALTRCIPRKLDQLIGKPQEFLDWYIGKKRG